MRPPKLCRTILALLLVIAGVVVAGCCSTCYTVTLKQTGSNVVATGSGAINFIPANYLADGSFKPFIRASDGAILTGRSGGQSGFMNATGPTNFGGGGMAYVDSGSGDLAGVVGNGFHEGNGIISVPDDYGWNTALSGSATWNNVTLASLGVTPGNYVWTWGAEANQNLTLIIGPFKWWWWLKPSYWRFHFPEWRTPPTWPPPRELPRPTSGDRGKVVVPMVVIPQR